MRLYIVDKIEKKISVFGKFLRRGGNNISHFLLLRRRRFVGKVDDWGYIK